MNWMLIAWLLIPAAFDLGPIKTEQNLERRSELALDNANTALDQARDSYNAGELAKSQASLDEVRESVDLAFHSLQETGKDARRSPKFFKRAELKTRELVRRLDGLRQSVNFEDRALVEAVRERVSQVHDELLQGLMSKKK